MKLCYNQATTMKNSNLEDDLKYCEQYGYDLIEIRIDKLKDYLTRHKPEELADFFEKSQIKPFAFNGLEEFNYRSKKDFEAIWDDAKLCCSLSGLLGCKMLTMDPAFDVGHFKIGKIQRDTEKTVRELLSYTDKYGMKLAFEFCGAPACCVNTYGQAYELVKSVNSQNFGIILDFFHFHAMGSKLEDLLASDVNKIFLAHIDDCEEYPLGQLTDADRVWPGDGVIDIDGIMKALLKLGYDGVYSLELFRPEYWDMPAGDVIRIGKEKSDKMLKAYY